MPNEELLACSFQARVGEWMEQCFTPTIIADKLERADRFIEESLELVQATGYSADRAHALVDYVFNRPVGEPFQEVGGVRVTLAALCNPHGIDEDAAAETELARVWTKIDVIRAKQATKPVGSALPIPSTRPDDTVKLREALEGVRDFLMSAPMESGCCCCGSPVEGHGFGDGHSPVDELSYAAQGQIERIDAALRLEDHSNVR